MLSERTLTAGPLRVVYEHSRDHRTHRLTHRRYPDPRDSTATELHRRDLSHSHWSSGVGNTRRGLRFDAAGLGSYLGRILEPRRLSADVMDAALSWISGAGHIQGSDFTDVRSVRAEQRAAQRVDGGAPSCRCAQLPMRQAYRAPLFLTRHFRACAPRSERRGALTHLESRRAELEVGKYTSACRRVGSQQTARASTLVKATTPTHVISKNSPSRGIQMSIDL
jgi:hypothetical protein